MKTRKPLRRKTPLSPVSKNKEKRARRFIPESVRKIVRARSGGICESINMAVFVATGTRMKCNARATEMHHVLPKSRGGKNTVQNLLDLCSFCHPYCKSHPIQSREAGILQ